MLLSILMGLKFKYVLLVVLRSNLVIFESEFNLLLLYGVMNCCQWGV